MVDAPIQGLRIALKLADVADTNEVLANLNLNTADLDKIRNISNAGVEQSDIKSLSGLTVDLDKEVVAIFNETSSYDSITSTLNDGRRRIAGNLNITGQIIAPSFKFNKVAFDSKKTYPTPFAATGGAGTGATFTVIRRIGTLGYDVTLSSGGTGYILGNTLTILGTAVDGLAPANNITITVTTVASGVITAFTIPAAGAAGNTTKVYENAIATVDFSTSRASAWSSFGNPSDSIFYGGDLRVSGTTSSVELSSLEFAGPIKAKQFDSQIPTHKIRVNIDGLDYDLYAMKGIPIRFKGFFRTVNSTIKIAFNRIDILGADGITRTIAPSWILRNTVSLAETIIRNRTAGSGTSRNSIITYFDSSSIERDIEFFYPVDSVTKIELNEVRVYGIPNVRMDKLTDLTVLNGDLIEMPNLRPIYPILTYLNLSNNDLTRSDTVNLRTFTPQVLERIPLSLKTLELKNNVYGNAFTANTALLPNLETLDFSCSINSNRRMTGESPAIGSSLLTYNISGNRFSTLHPSVVASNTLKNLIIPSNGITGTISSTNLNDLEVFYSGANAHAIYNAQNKTKLITYYANNMNYPEGSNIGTNIFNGCTSLQTISLSYTNITGALPKFEDNANLTSFSSVASKWSDASASNSIAADTFGALDDSPVRTKLSSFDLRSDNLRNQIETSAFRGMTALRRLYVTSFGAGITGGYPSSISNCINLTELYLANNKMSGVLLVSNFANNKRIITIDLSNNQFSGAFPSLQLDFLKTLQLSTNQLTAIGAPFCRSLTYLNASNNLIATVPDFKEAINISEIYLNNNPTMEYAAGTFKTTTTLRRLEMANCGLDQGTINSIIEDLNSNYARKPRSGVTVNLLGNSPPSPFDSINVIISRLRRAGWTLGLDS